uniref:Uncharacterized protein n=1 Tax=Arion vulgaris TaxID=1028688 RepID=A0A0B7AR94_9EUPU
MNRTVWSGFKPKIFDSKAKDLAQRPLIYIRCWLSDIKTVLYGVKIWRTPAETRRTAKGNMKTLQTFINR